MHDVPHPNQVIILWFIVSDAWPSIAFMYTLNLTNWKGLRNLICMFMVGGSIWFIWQRMGGNDLSSRWPLNRPFDGSSWPQCKCGHGKTIEWCICNGRPNNMRCPTQPLVEWWTYNTRSPKCGWTCWISHWRRSNGCILQHVMNWGGHTTRRNNYHVKWPWWEHGA